MAGLGNSHEDGDGDGGSVAAEVGKPRLKEPPRYAVILHNDDYSTMEFVVEVLVRFFHRTQEEAVEITLKVHHQGRGTAGIYGHQIAETKAAQVEEYARASGFPLKASIEEAP